MDEQVLRQLSTEILTDIKEWRTANPRATYVQIEDEVHKRLNSREPMEHAPNVEKVFFPLDEELGLLPGKLAPRQYEHPVHLACFMPFDKAAQMMEEIVSVHTNEETVRRLTEQVGSWMETAQTAEVEAEEDLEREGEQPPERYVISPDGAMISLVHKQWVETRTVAIGEPQEKLNAEGEREIHVGKLSYFSRLADALTFIVLNYLVLARDLVEPALRPWESVHRPATPQQVRRGINKLLPQLDTPACSPQPRGKSPGRTKGVKIGKAKRFSVVRKTPKVPPLIPM
jgi:hypothetical protein